MVNQFLKGLSYHLLPPRCLLCRAPGAADRDICEACQRDLPWLGRHCRHCALPIHNGAICGRCLQRQPSFYQCLAAWEYTFPVDRMVTAFKHRRQLGEGELLARLWCEWQDEARDQLPELLVPVPLHWRRALHRGFNQAELLARYWGRQLDIPLARPLRRYLPTPAQQQLSARERRRNLRNAFTLPRPGPVAGRHIALVDDVLTTGTTAETLAAILLGAGAQRVDVWCLARTP